MKTTFSTSALRNSARRNLIIIIALTITIISCTERDNPFSQSVVETKIDGLSKQELIENVDNLLFLADYALSNNPLTEKGSYEAFAPSLDEETVYVRGKADGSIETERHTTVKGAPLISVRLTHGNGDFSTSTITRTYDSEADFTNGRMSSERNTTVIGLASGQIKTTTIRDEKIVSNSIKTPVVTVKRDVTTKRQGSLDGSIEVVRTRTVDGSLISRTLIYGRDDGAILTKRIYPDLSWEIAAVRGKASGEIETTITTSEPTAVKLNSPTEITASSVTLSWSENTDSNFAQYIIYQSQFSGVSSSDTLVGTVEEQATTNFTVSGLSAETSYYFRVYVINDVGQAKGSNEVLATTK
jgi:hypothetical protein